MYLSPETIATFNKTQMDYAEKLGEPLPEPRWDNYKKQLMDLNPDDEFYLLVDLKHRKVTWHHGVDKWLGYQNPQEHEHSFIPSIVHPFIFNYYYAFAMGAYALILDISAAVSYMSHRYKITLPLRKADGTFVCVQQSSYPCEFDANGHIVTHFNRYTISGNYIGQPLQPSIMIDNTVQDDFMTRLYHRTASFMSVGDKKNMFTRDELKVLTAALKISRLKVKRNEHLQKQLHIDIKHKNTSIKEKAETLFLTSWNKNKQQIHPLSNFDTCLPKFDDMYMISEFLHRSHILPIMDIKLRQGEDIF